MLGRTKSLPEARAHASRAAAVYIESLDHDTRSFCTGASPKRMCILNRPPDESMAKQLEDHRSNDGEVELGAMMTTEWKLEPGVASKLFDAFTVAGLRVDAIEPGRAMICSFTVPPRLTVR